jgi:quinol monooxygenase YgiN
VSYRFTPTKVGARVIVRHRDFGSADAASEHAVGWERTLDLLCAYLAHDPASGETAPIDAVEIDIGDDVTAIVEKFRSKLRDPSEPLSLLARFEVETADESKVEAAFRKAQFSTRMEPGCLAFSLDKDPRHSGRFTVFERWRSLAALESHLRADYSSRLRAELNQLIVGEPAFEVLLPAA